MSRTIELGRAVLSSPTAKLELWLTTLITVSQPQISIGLDRLSESKLIALLTSGDVWVGCGNGMHLSFDIKNQREALPSSLIRQLADSILAAPAWGQLELQPSLPFEGTLAPGKLYLKLDLSRQGAGHAIKRGTRTFANVPIQECVPPEEVPIFDLQSVEYLLNIIEIRDRVTAPRSRGMKATRNNRNCTPMGAVPSMNEDDQGSAILFDEDMDGGMLQWPLDSAPEILFESGPEDKSEYAYDIDFPGVRSPTQPAAARKRPRGGLDCCSPYLKKARGSFFAVEATGTDETRPTSESQPFSTMLDAAMRISVFGNLRGSTGNVKIKASTFVENLANIAPFLWRPGYRTAMAASSSINPALSLSLARVGSRAKSGILRTKTAAATSALSQGAEDRAHANGHNVFDISSVSSQLAARFWIKTQKGLLCKPAPTFVHAFCNLREQPQDESSADEILEANSTHLDLIESASA